MKTDGVFHLFTARNRCSTYIITDPSLSPLLFLSKVNHLKRGRVRHASRNRIAFVFLPSSTKNANTRDPTLAAPIPAALFMMRSDRASRPQGLPPTKSVRTLFWSSNPTTVISANYSSSWHEHQAHQAPTPHPLCPQAAALAPSAASASLALVWAGSDGTRRGNVASIEWRNATRQPLPCCRGGGGTRLQCARLQSRQPRLRSSVHFRCGGPGGVLRAARQHGHGTTAPLGGVNRPPINR